MIKLINIEKFMSENGFDGPITSPNIMMGNSLNFHPKGVQSEEIFGLVGSKERSTNYSWIELNCKIIHPVVYNILISKLERTKIEDLLSTENTYDLDENGHLVLNKDGNGELNGFTSFIDNIDKFRFRKDEDKSADKNKLIDLLYEKLNDDSFFITKLIVIPPNFRETQVFEESGDITISELDTLYSRIINLSYQVNSVSGNVYDVLSFRMQSLLKELYEFARIKISKKNGMIRNMMLGKRVDFTGRSVISPNPNLNAGEVGLPLRMICQLFEPYILYGILNSDYSTTIPNEFHKEAYKFLGKETLISYD